MHDITCVFEWSDPIIEEVAISALLQKLTDFEMKQP